jgi:hypothetical protein
MESSGVSTVVAGEEFASVIESDPECVSATFGKDLVFASLGMVSPDGLSQALDRFVG